MSKRDKDTEFEISFFEGLIKKDPTFIEALTHLADLYTKVGRVEEGLAIDEKLSMLKPDDPVVLYNLACSYSLVNRLDESLRAFKKAIKAGYDDFDFIEQDEDLDNLRKDARFKRFFRRITQLNKRDKKQIFDDS